ncbi:hypothetical protein ABBQ32_002632 [Trebouxia sp. C0010 RCD-2024]
MLTCVAGTTKGFFDNAVGSEFAKRSSARAKPAPAKPASTRPTSSKGFFDNAVGSEFAKRSPAPARAEPKQSTPTKPISGGGFFDNAIGSEFARRSPAKAAPKQPAPRASSSVGAQFAKRSAAPAKPSAPKQPVFSRAASSGAGFFDSVPGAQFVTRSVTPNRPTPKQAPSASASDGAQVAKRSESPPKEAAPKEGALTWPASAGGFFETALGSHFASRFNLKPSENAGAKTDGPRMAASQEASEEGSSQPDQPDVTFDSILEHASELYAQALVVLSNVTVPGNVKQALLVFSMAMVLYVAYVHIFYSLQKGV